MDNLTSDLLLNIAQFLNVRDSGRLAATSQRFYYLVHQYRKLRGPELVTVSTWEKDTYRQRQVQSIVRNDPVNKLQQPPNLVLAFSDPVSGGRLKEELSHDKLPPNTIVLGACAYDIQVNQPPGIVEHQSKASLMYASFPDAHILPFSWQFSVNPMETELQELQRRLEESKVDWKAVIIYGSGQGAGRLDKFVSSLQTLMPNAAIVGGVCNRGYVSHPPSQKTKEELSQLSIRQLRRLQQEMGGPSDLVILEKSELVDIVWDMQNTQAPSVTMVDDAIFGVVLGGDAPVRTMVSRGVRSIIHGIPQSSSPYVVHETVLSRPEDDDFLFRGADLQPIHHIIKVRNKETDEILSASQLMAKTSNEAEFIGIQRPHEDGFELHMLSEFCDVAGSYLVLTDGSDAQLETLDKAEIDFFVLDGEACLQDMESTVTKLQQQTEGEQILGAVMFSCNGRGPKRSGFIPEEMADANRFAKVFPDVPCLGFYAGGEVGPSALAGNQAVFQTGKAAVQGFTAVFCLFIVPVLEHSGKYALDDCRDNVTQFIQSRLSLSPSN